MENLSLIKRMFQALKSKLELQVQIGRSKEEQVIRDFLSNNKKNLYISGKPGTGN